MPLLRRTVVGLTVASGLAAAALVVPAGAGPLEFTGRGQSSAGPTGVRRVVSAATPANASSLRTGSVGITGSVSGLYPGATSPLPLTVTNAATTPVTVTSVTTTVANASTLCTKKNLHVTKYTHGALVVPAGGHAVVTVQATLVTAAGNACQGAVFRLTYHGKATPG